MIGALLNAALGAATVFAFAPHRLWWLPFITLAWWFARVVNTPTPRAAFASGLAFGLGLFGFGVWWIYIALNSFGQMPAPLAVLATALLAGYMALWPALAALATRWVAPAMGNAVYLCMAVFFVATEWVRGVLFSGFPWLTVGSSQAAESPLMGYAPLVGGTGLSLIVCGLAALIAWAWPRRMPRPTRLIAAGVLCATTLGVGQGLGTIAWSTPSATPLTVSLLQGNIAQDLKFRPEVLLANAAKYEALMHKAKGRLLLFPETTFVTPLAGEKDQLVRRMAEIALEKQRSMVFGAPWQAGGEMFNAAIAVDGQTVQTYRKQHLVPFGEYMPLKEWLAWFYNNVAIPLSGFSRGAETQTTLNVAGEKLGLSICYEDVFAASVRPLAGDATLLVNLTNDAWYGQSWAAEQHAQMAQMRAAEFARPMLRATNTGITLVTDARGREVARLPWFSEGVLEVSVAGHSGPTPYLSFGDLPILLVLLAVTGIAIARRLQSRND